MTHLRPLREGARNTREHVGLKEPWRADPLVAPPEVRAVFEQAPLQTRPGKEGIRITKGKAPQEGGGSPEPPMPPREETPAASSKSAEAWDIVRVHAIAAVATYVVPIPLVAFGVLGVQQRMIRQLARLYEVEYSKQLAESLIGSVLGISTARVLTGLLRLVPGLGALGILALPSASTYALGKVFIKHFESGGTLLTFDVARAKAAYDKHLAEKSE